MEISEAAKLFIQYNYPEWKDLAKSFLTLSSATLVFSLTFSEKIVDIRSATARARRTMLAAWLFLIASIISCGVAICFLSLSYSRAGMQVAFGTARDALFLGQPYYFYAVLAERFLLLTGATFVAGLICLLVAAVGALGPKAGPDRPPS